MPDENGHVRVPDGVTEIPAFAFAECDGDTNREPGNIRNGIDVGEQKSMPVGVWGSPERDESNRNDVANCYCGKCFNDSGLAIRTIDLNNVTTIGEKAFLRVYSLIEIDLRKVTDVGWAAFATTPGLQRIMISEDTKFDPRGGIFGSKMPLMS